MASWGYSAPSQMAAMLKAAGFHAGSRVLDVGCGTGLSGAAMRAAGIGASGGIIGIDISDESLDEAFARKCYQDTKLHNMEEAWPFADATFDAVVAVGTSSCVENFDHFYSEMCRVAKQGALISWTCLEHEWATDEQRCRSSATDLAELQRWRQVRFDPPRPYTPALPGHEDPDGEAARQKYHIVAYRRLQKVLEEHELQRRAEEAKKMRREQAVASIEVSRSSKEEERQREREKQQWENKVARFQKQSSFQKSKPSAEPGEEQEDEEEMLSDDSL